VAAVRYPSHCVRWRPLNCNVMFSSSMWKRLRFVVCACLLLMGSACPPIKTTGALKDHTYTSPDGEFSVRAPDIPSLGAKDKAYPDQLFVDFYMGDGYWTPFGLYTVEWVKLVRPIKAEEFDAIAQDIVKENVSKRFAGKGEFRIADYRSLTESTRPAHQALAVGQSGGIEAFYVVTVLSFDDRLAFVSVLEAPTKAVFKQSMPTTLPIRNDWYDAMLVSLTRLK
jgi:hypothetical protein